VGFDIQIAEGLDGVDRTVVEFDALADPDRAATDDDDAFGLLVDTEFAGGFIAEQRARCGTPAGARSSSMGFRL